MFLALAPGVAAGVVPWWITGWESTGPGLRAHVGGVLLVLAGSGVLVHAFARFLVEGLGTPYEAYRTVVPGWWPRTPRSTS